MRDDTENEIRNILDKLIDWLVEDHIDLTAMDKESKELWLLDKQSAVKRLQDIIEATATNRCLEELEGIRVTKLHLEKFTTDHADGYNMAAEDFNYEINRRIATLKSQQDKDKP